MYVLGLTGSIAMGKTTVAEMFEGLGFPVFHSDKVLHRLYAKRKHLLNQIEEAFPGVLKNGALDRQALAKKVLGKPEALSRLEQISHPYVFREIHKFLKAGKSVKAPLVVLDIPLLFETGADDICDGVLVVSATPEAQKKRVLERGKLTEKQLEDILARQMPDADKRKNADFVIETGTTLEKTRAQVEKLVAKLVPKGA